MMAGAMEEPRACVVEVTQIVPVEDVPYVAARVAERLGMPVDRVRKLIEGRTGPITRPLRSDKADAIAQTFEAAGVSVVIRPATEDDQVGGVAVAPVTPAATGPAMDDEQQAAPESEAESAPTEDGVTEPHPDADPDTDPDPEPELEPELELDHDPDHEPDNDSEPDPDHDPTPVSDLELEPDPEFEATHDPEPEVESEFEQEAEPDLESEFEHEVEPEQEQELERESEFEQEVEPEQEPAPWPEPDPYDEFDEDEDLAAAAAADGHGVVIEFDEGDGGAPTEAGHPEPPTPAAGPGHATDDQHAAFALEPDDDGDETNDPGPFGLDARGEVRVRVEHDPLFGEDLTETHEGSDRVGAGPRDAGLRATTGGPAVLADQPSDESTIGRPASGGREASPFGDPDTWGGDDPSGGWIIGSRKARRFEVLHDDEPVSELADGAAGDAREHRDDSDDPDTNPGPVSSDGADTAHEDRLPWRGVPGIGRESRRPSYGVRAGSPGPGRADVADQTASKPGDDAMVPDASQEPAVDDPVVDDPVVDDLAVDDPVVDETADEHPDAERSGVEAEATKTAPTVVPPAGAPTRPRAPARAPVAVPVPQPGARTAAGVPTAWRGLGAEDRGPARPVDAQLPRRVGEGYDERVRRVAVERVTRRRTGMLIALAVALGLFVLAQAWVAGRAAPAFDAGLHRFRDADFGAAQRVWTQLAGAGDANAQFMLGYLSEAGLGRPWSARAAAAWYRLAADAGHAEAQWRLGLLYEMGLGVPHDPSAALRWWGAAAAGGHGESAYRLGRARLEGVAGPSDVDGALDAFERAVELGWPVARPYRDALFAASSGHPHPGALP